MPIDRIAALGDEVESRGSMRVLVTDGDERASLSVVRSLGTLHDVHVCATGASALAGRSRFASRYHRLPDPSESEIAFAEGVRRVVTQNAIDVVLPVSDSAHKALLECEKLGAPLLAPSRAAYERLSDKAEVARLAAEVGLGIPRTLEARSLEEALDSAAEIGWPLVLKPARSVVGGPEGTGQTKLGVVTTADAAALRAAWPQASRAGVVLLQRHVPGRGEGIFALRHGGETVAAFAHRRLREKPPEGGVSVLRESIPIAPERLARVERILDAVGFEGVAMAEFRVHGEEAWLMEFNARLWGSVQLAIDAGVDFPRLLLDTLTGSRRVPSPPPFRTGVRLRWLLGDLDHAILLARGAQDTQGRSGLGQALRVLLTPAGPDCRWEVLRANDPMPFVHELRRWLAGVMGARRG